MERAYTVREIDALREACRLRWFFGTTNMEGIYTGIYHYEDEKNRGVEELVRTCMIAGITAEQIYESDRQERKD